VRKYEDETWDDDRFLDQETQYHGGKEIMVWGCISKKGPRILVRLNGRVDAKAY
jgi:hypothetical protein